MTDPWAYAVRWMPLTHPWLLGVSGHNSDFIQSVTHEVARYTSQQSSLCTATYYSLLKAPDLSHVAQSEIDFLEQSWRLALDTSGRFATLMAQVDQERLVNLPIE